MAATRTLARMEGPQWARIEDTAMLCSPQKAKLDDNLAITVNFKLNGGIRRNFTRDLWEKAYHEHDAGLLMIFWVELLRNPPLLSKPLKTDKFKRRAIFFWTTNPQPPPPLSLPPSPPLPTTPSPQHPAAAPGLALPPPPPP